MRKRFKDWRKPKIVEGKPTKWNWLVRHAVKLKLGKNTDIGAFTYINAENEVVIEDDVQVGSHCSIYSVSTIDKKAGRVVLKKNCKVGTHSVIMPGVTVGENSVIGAFSFVNKNVSAGMIAYGIPIKIVRKIK